MKRRFSGQKFPEFEEYARRVPRMLPSRASTADQAAGGFWGFWVQKHREYKAPPGATAMMVALIAKTGLFRTRGTRIKNVGEQARRAKTACRGADSVGCKGFFASEPAVVIIFAPPILARGSTPGRVVLTNFQKQSIVVRSVTRPASGFGGAAGAEAIEAVGHEFEVRRLAPAVVASLPTDGDHFARWNAFGFVSEIFLGGDGTQCLDGIVILDLGEGLGYFAIIFDSVGKIHVHFLLHESALSLRYPCAPHRACCRCADPIARAQ